MTDEAEIKDLLEIQYPKHLNSGDVEAYVSLYSDDVLWAVPNMPDANSPEQIGSLLGKLLSKVAQTVKVTVAGSELDSPSLAVKVRLSMPAKSAVGT